MSDAGLQFELARAIRENELFLQFQPRVLLTTLELRGVETLVRWRHPERGLVPPPEFLAEAAHAGLMRDLEAWVMRQSLLQAAVWRQDRMNIGVSVNISASLLIDEPFLRLCDRTLKIQGDPRAFTFEVAAASLAGAGQPADGLARLRDRGARLALDDVTEPRELDDTSWFQWDYVKLGRALVSRAAHDDGAEATLGAIVTRAIGSGAQVVAVGVEDDATIALLRDAGAYLAQGYAIAPPLSAKELSTWSEGRRRPA